MRDKAVAYYVYYKNWKGWFSGGTYYRNDEKEAFKDAIAGMSSYDTTIIGIDVRRRPLSPAKPKRVARPKSCRGCDRGPDWSPARSCLACRRFKGTRPDWYRPLTRARGKA